MVVIRVLAVIALIGSVAWFLADPNFEPTLAVVGSLATVVSVFVVEKRRASKPPQQRQAISKGSIGIQAGGDVTIGDLGGKKDAR